jgi:hypothetical protein
MSKFGSFLKILAQVGPLVLMLNPVTAALAPVIIHAIDEAQKIKGSGAEKKTHAMAIVTDAVNLAHGAGVKGFEQPAVVLETASDGIDTVVGAVKIIAGTKVAVDLADAPKEA